MGQKALAPCGQLFLLHVPPPLVRDPAGLLHAGDFRCGSEHGGERTGEKEDPRHRAGAYPECSVCVQVHGLCAADPEPDPLAVSQRESPQRARHRPSHRHLVLYAPGGRVSCRCVPGQNPRGAEHHRLCALCLVLPAASCGPHRQGKVPPPAAEEPEAAIVPDGGEGVPPLSLGRLLKACHCGPGRRLCGHGI